MNFLNLLTKREVTRPATEEESKQIRTGGPHGQWKLTYAQKRDVIRRVATFGLSQYEAVDYVKEKYGVTIAQNSISASINSKKWGVFFRFEREKYLNNLSEVAGANQRVRLDRQELVYKEAVKTNDGYLALAASRQQREEIMPKSNMGQGDLTINYNNQLNFNAMSDEEFKIKKVEIAKRIKELENKGVELKGAVNGTNGTTE